MYDVTSDVAEPQASDTIYTGTYMQATTSIYNSTLNTVHNKSTSNIKILCEISLYYAWLWSSEKHLPVEPNFTHKHHQTKEYKVGSFRIQYSKHKHKRRTVAHQRRVHDNFTLIFCHNFSKTLDKNNLLSKANKFYIADIWINNVQAQHFNNNAYDTYTFSLNQYR